jgi:hypothetical protein
MAMMGSLQCDATGFYILTVMLDLIAVLKDNRLRLEYTHLAKS